VTDDPEPVEAGHFEVYLASAVVRDDAGWSGTCPHLEVNYGAVRDLQLHVIVPAAFASPLATPWHWGLGDAELGAKYRFVREHGAVPQLGVFPLVEVPTGSSRQGLGSGHAQAFLPLWLQQQRGPWTTYGGLGYWINPGSGERDWWLAGWQVQRQLSSSFTLGSEVYHTTPLVEGGEAETRFDVGLVADLRELQHLLLSAGRGIQGPTRFQAYAGYQLTFGLAGRAAR
jgi:hypothetical protein